MSTLSVVLMISAVLLALGVLGLVVIVIAFAVRYSNRSVPPPPPRVSRPTVDDDEVTMISVTPNLEAMLKEAGLDPGASPVPEAGPAKTTRTPAPVQRTKTPSPASGSKKKPAATSTPMYREPQTAETIPILVDPEAEEDEPTHASAMLLMSAAGQTHVGKRRKRNEDRFAIVDRHNLFVVADGMGGYAGGALAAQLACDTIVDAFNSQEWGGTMSNTVPRRGAELALAIQQANKVVFERASADPELKGMGTTVVCARFAPKKSRVYLGHIGDSRCYRLRNGHLHQMTTDHTMENLGVTGKYARYLSRALGVGPGVRVDLIIAKPRVDDIYLFCSDGLTKMIKDDDVIRDVLVDIPDLQQAVDRLVDMANDAGGKDNVTVLCVGVKDAQGIRAAAGL